MIIEKGPVTPHEPQEVWYEIMFFMNVRSYIHTLTPNGSPYLARTRTI